jgi:hypothetical protein
MDSIADLQKQKKELVTLKIGQWKLPNLRTRSKNEEKIEEHKKSVRHYHEYQDKHDSVIKNICWYNDKELPKFDEKLKTCKY